MAAFEEIDRILRKVEAFQPAPSANGGAAVAKGVGSVAVNGAVCAGSCAGEEKKAKAKQEKREHGAGKKESKKEAKEGKKEKKHAEDAGKDASARAPRLSQPPEFWAHRIAVWEKVAERRRAEKPPGGAPIKITLPDGKQVDGVALQTSPMNIAESISQGLARDAVVALVNGKPWDMGRPLEESCSLVICTFEDPAGKHTFWHSSAHILGKALETKFGCKLGVGPPLEEGGFYYDCDMDGSHFSADDYKDVEKDVNDFIKQKAPFERLVLKKEEALDMFRYNPYKQEIIQKKVPDGETCTAYRCGPLIDLCKGPHVPDTGRIKAMAITKHSSSYWLGNADNASLQRVYGISFPDKARMKEWQHFMEEAAKRDHRKLGPEQGLFFFDEISPGSCFFLPHGARIYNKLIEFIKIEYRKRGFQEVISPNIFNVDLWKTSGHYDNYRENLFLLDVEGQEFGIKPMNCPGHCVMFKRIAKALSYRDLPLRMADFGVLHRNELSGALSGLTRVRRFQQDDAHIFCRRIQIEQEVDGALEFLNHVYGKFGFKFTLNLSTRPQKFMGDIQLWEDAEKALASCLDKSGHKWAVNAGDGAFYGPKIDIQVEDALKRRHQCATIQLDFQLPIRFDLSVKVGDAESDEGSYERPVIIHRAILGSVERMIAILVEHTGGKWPLWLSPRQVMVVPVAANFNDYAKQVRDRLWDAGFYADADVTGATLNKKVRSAQVAQYNFILVVGAQEIEQNTVAIRVRDSNELEHGVPLDQFIERLKQMVAAFQ